MNSQGSGNYTQLGVSTSHVSTATACAHLHRGKVTTTDTKTQQLLCAVLCSIVSNSLWLHGLQPTRILCPQDYSSKNTGVGCKSLLQGNLPYPGIEPESLESPALSGGFFTTEPPGKPQQQLCVLNSEPKNLFKYLTRHKMLT